ncbi:hypothetical protein NM208_g16893 [Fusarium decemcellulare]|uniref:Uncharacterized protein n=1 Tax=Fusarium decemcellulare TaxID=57161 RepID=A0ACC1R8Y6_9HYPO|nr:hypothetical protein NM208_g16893 [Fusarium decemcellulare]
MAIRFTSFEWYKQILADKQTGVVSGKATFLAGLAAGVTEAVAVVTPMEVIKIRLQAQHHSMADPLDIPQVPQRRPTPCTPSSRRKASAPSTAVYFKEWLKVWQPQYEGTNLPNYQTTLIGLVSGAMGPLSNAPIDTIKTRLQKTPAEPGTSAWTRISRIAADMFKQEGMHAFYKGITPRVMRVAPGQAVTFTVYEYLKEKLEKSNISLVGGKYEE